MTTVNFINSHWEMLMQDVDLSLSILTDATVSHSCNLNKTYCNHLDNITVLTVLINWIHNNALQG